MNLLITGAFPATAAQLAEFEAHGFRVDLQADEREKTANPEKYNAVICNALFLYNDIRSFSSLRTIQLTSAGRDRLPEEEIGKRGITVYTAGNAYSVPMAEWAVFSLLSIYKNARFLQEHRGEWVKNRSVGELYGKNAAIFGFGNAGEETAKRLKAFGCRVTAVDRREIVSPYADEYIPARDAARALRKADILVISMPLTGETERFFDKEKLSLCKDTAAIVNIARGRLIDEAALTDELRRGRFLGAALDVFETEPLPPDSPLYTLKNVYLSPHNSFVGEGNGARLFGIIRKNLFAEA